MTLQPTGNRLLIRRAVAEAKTPGGIIIPDNAKETSRGMRGTVLAVGPGTAVDTAAAGVQRHREVAIPVGAEVIFGRYAGTEVDFGDEKDLVLVSEDDVLAVAKA